MSLKIELLFLVIYNIVIFHCCLLGLLNLAGIQFLNV